MRKKDILMRKAYELRKKVLRLIVEGKAGHTGGDLSELDILTVLFYEVMKYDPKNPKWEDRDRFILSKGHSAESYYAVLGDVGFINDETLATLYKYGTKLIGHPNNMVPGVEVNSGALGHGLSVGVGMALAARLDNKDYRVFVLMGDGEQAEGSVWEAAMSAAHYKLANLCAVIDRNNLQISGKTEEVMSIEPLTEKWRSFGFHVIEADGHDYGQLIDAFEAEADRPKLVIANTVKGKGVSFMENVAKWHHGVPSPEQLSAALKEIDEKLSEVGNG